jgi:hypothetical protein
MVRLTLPNRLKSYNGSQPGSRSSSPMRGGNIQPLVLKTTVLKVLFPGITWYLPGN